MKNSDKGELHLMVLWERARYKECEILNDLRKELKIVETYDIKWSQERVSDNFTRFYGVKLGPNSHKEQECGSGRFLLIVLWDPEPQYEITETSRGHELVNTRMFRLKDRYRSWTGGGHKIHATNSPEETNHDITLLLGKNTRDYLKCTRDHWQGKHIFLDQDLPGCEGWDNLKQLFYVLNNTMRYVVLRNHECLPHEFTSEEHGDIDILAEHGENAAYLLNAKKVFDLPYRVQYKNIVSGEEVQWDIRHLGDDYYCYEWEENMLTSRVLNEHDIYIQSPENYFYSLVYHVTIHKNRVAPDYYPRMQMLAGRVPEAANVNLEEYDTCLDVYYKLLLKYMSQQGYTFTQADDISVYYNKWLLKSNKAEALLRKQSRMNNVKQVRVNQGGNKQCYFFTAEREGRQLFIRWGCPDPTSLYEYKLGRLLFEECPQHVVEPLAWKMEGEIQYIATQYIKGATLEECINNGLSQQQKESYIAQLAELAKALLKTKIVHRDIRPANLIVNSEGVLKLIDFEFAVKADAYRELPFVRRNMELIRELGDSYAFARYEWDDMYSISLIMKELGANIDKDTSLKFVTSHIGELHIKGKGMVPKVRLPRIMVKIISCFILSRRARRLFRIKHEKRK